MAQRSKGIAGSAALLGAAALYLVYVGIKDVPFTEGLRAIFRGQSPEARAKHFAYVPKDSGDSNSGGIGKIGATASKPIDMSQTTVVGGIRVATAIATNVQNMLDAAKADGIILKGSGWRSIFTQRALRLANGYTSDDQPSGSGGRTPVAIPGQSRHEAGQAIDFTTGSRSIRKTDKEYQWLANNAATYGFYNLPSEAWHWSTDGH